MSSGLVDSSILINCYTLEVEDPIECSGVRSILCIGGYNLSPTFSLIALGTYIIKLRLRLYIKRA